MIFDVITAEAIKKAAAKTKGSHGPSGGDAENWKKQLLSFGPSSHALCEAIAAATRRLCSTPVDPACLEALLASRLIPLEKPAKDPPGEHDPPAKDPPGEHDPPKPLGVRSIGVGEVFIPFAGQI